MPVHPSFCRLWCPKHTQPMRPQKGRIMKTSEIDFSCLSLRNLRAMLPSTRGVETPSETWFRENPDEIMFRDFCANGTVTVYSNGFYTYTEDEGEHLAILRADGFSRLRYDFADNSSSIVEEADYLDSSYLVALYINGKSQWDRNSSKREAYRHGYYLENDSSDWGEEAMVPSTEEQVVQAENEKEMASIVGRALSILTDRQREIVKMHIMEGITQEEIASMIGLSRCSVQTHLERAMKKMRNYFGKDVIKTPLVFGDY